MTVCRSGFLAALDRWLDTSCVGVRARDSEPWTGSGDNHDEGLDWWSRVGSRGLRQECRDKAGRASDRNTGGRTGDGVGQDTD